MDDLSRSLPHLVYVAELIDYERNARTHSADQIEQIKASYRSFGFCGVIGYDSATKGLKIGHGRKTAALEMWAAGEEVWGPGKRVVLPRGQLPAIDVSGLSVEEMAALVIADNKLALNAGWDEAKLIAEMDALAAMDFDLSIIGFDEAELDRLRGLGDAGKSGAGKMAAEFLIPPFSVLNAREGWWQDRKRQWLELGIKSEIGRGENLLHFSDTLIEPDPEKRAAMQERRGKGRTFGQDILDNEGGPRLNKGVRRSTGAQPVEGQPGQRSAVPGNHGRPASPSFTDRDHYRHKSGERPAGLGGVTMQSLSSHPRYYEQKTAAEARLGRKLDNDEFERDHWAEPDSEIISGTSIFDPVLCELVYRWFSPKGGQVLDPFAGGSVRGIVAGALGRRYCGIDLRREQVEANQAQWPLVSAQLEPQAEAASEVPPLTVDEMEGLRVVRDDLVLGGTKRRALDRLIGSIDQAELIYGTPAYGFAQIALAASCRAAGKRATVVVAGRKHRHQRTQLAEQLGAEIVEVERAGYLTVVQKRARDLAAERGAYLVPFGMEDEIFIEAIAAIARELPGPAPAEVWCVAGSGVLSRALQRAWPDAAHHAVQIGKDPQVGGARLWVAPEKFEESAQQPPPWPSCDNYDAKAWRFMREHAAPDALFWNLGADIDEPADRPAPEWRVGDSAEILPALELEADLVFSCPPYGDLEVYSDDPLDISTMELADFDRAYRDIIAKAVSRLKPDRFAVFVVGDYRSKGPGFYRRFISKTEDAFEAAGAQLYNVAILVTSVGSLPIRAAKQFRSTRKLGKALRNGTKILTPSGWVPIEALCVGNKIIAGDGTITRVSGVFPQGIRQMFTVTFNDGTTIDADAQHLWQIRTFDRAEILTTAQIVERWGTVPSDPRPAIPACGQIRFPRRPVALHPYLVGLLLGDGGLSGTTPILSTADAEIAMMLPAILPPGMIVKGRGYDFRLVGVGPRFLRNPLTIELRRLGIMGKLAAEKSVPECYLWNSPDVRLAVLRGLMDTDGCVSGRSNGTEFTSASAQLAADVAFLARSLGAKVTTSIKNTTHQPAHRVRISGGPCPFQLKRKADCWRSAHDRRVKRLDRRIASILPSESGLATCIAVEHPSSLFVAEHFIVTHNTHQDVLIFCKGDPRRATEACGPVDVSAALAQIEPEDEIIDEA